MLRLQGTGLTYPGPPPVVALRPSDLQVTAGEYIAVMGPSGSGKSTLLNVIGLLDAPTEGEYLFNGRDVGDLSEQDRSTLRSQQIGFVFQAFHLLPLRSAFENVRLALLYNGTARSERERLSLAALERVGLSGRTGAAATTLSGGERQRVAIARAVVSRPSILLCDEPTGNLDSGSAGEILDLLDEMNHAGITLIVITHDSVVAARASRRLTMSDGSLQDQDVMSA